jgi:hypothetical protein
MMYRYLHQPEGLCAQRIPKDSQAPFEQTPQPLRAPKVASENDGL